MSYNLLKHNSHYFITYHVTSHLNTVHLTYFHIIHILKDQNTILLNQLISINTQTLCNKYTKTQSYMQCDIMSVKNLVKRLGVYNKADHTLVSQVTFIK